MEPSKLVVVIPAHNEQESIGKVISEIFALKRDLTVIVVDDVSTDRTPIIAAENGALVVSLLINKGYAGAIQEGMLAALELGADYIVTCDADGQHDPQSLISVVSTLVSNDVDLVIGYRAKCARLSERLYKLYYRFKFNILDPLCGLKGYRASLIREYGCFETFDSIGTELMLWAVLNGKSQLQAAVNIRERLDKPRFGGLLKANLRIFRSLLATTKYIRQYKSNSLNL